MTGAVPWRPPAAERPPLDHRLWNALVSYAGAPIGLGGSASLAFAVVPPPPLGAPGARLRLSSGQEVVAVPVDFPFASTFEADLSIADLADLPPALRDALVEGILLTVAQELPLAAMPEIRSVGPLGMLGSGDDWPWFRLALAGIGEGTATIDASASPGDLAVIFADSPARRAWPGLAERLTGIVDATLGGLRLPVAALRDWRMGTMVVLDRGGEATVVRLRAAGRRYEFEARDGAWLCRVAEPRRGREDRDRMVEGAGRMDGESIDIDAIPVDVDFDLGRASVSLAEIGTWQPGSLVALPLPLTGAGVPVTLRVNGSAIGTGDIVSIDGRIAVRVSSLALRA